MGLYDCVKCEHPLPGDPPSNAEWQTKSMECEMKTYRIASDGYLWGDKGHHMETCGFRTWVPNTVRLYDFTGSIHFYDIIDNVWWEYTAVWVRGKLIDIVGGPQKRAG